MSSDSQAPATGTVPAAVQWARELRAALLEQSPDKPGDRDLAWALDPAAHDAFLEAEEAEMDARVRRAYALTHAVTFSWPHGLDVAPKRAVGPFPDVALVVARLRALQASGDPDFRLPTELA